MNRRALLPIAAIAVAAALSANLTSAQTVVEQTQEVDFARPEAWAMKYFASVTLLTSFAPPRAIEPGAFDLGLELGWIPALSEDQRRVGFNGLKVEDLNRSPVLPRSRVTIGLPWQLALDLSWVPPVTVEGVKANLLALGLERPLYLGERWALGARIYGQTGTTKGDYTCTAENAGYPAGSANNRFGCQAPSDDTAHLDYAGAALTGGYRFGGGGDTALHFGVYATHMDLEFQVDALTFDIHDRTRQVTDGWTWAAVTGVDFRIARATRLAFEAFYSPLDVARDRAAPDTLENDGLLNLRAMFRHTWR